MIRTLTTTAVLFVAMSLSASPAQAQGVLKMNTLTPIAIKQGANPYTVSGFQAGDKIRVRLSCAGDINVVVYIYLAASRQELARVQWAGAGPIYEITPDKKIAGNNTAVTVQIDSFFASDVKVLVEPVREVAGGPGGTPPVIPGPGNPAASNTEVKLLLEAVLKRLDGIERRLDSIESRLPPPRAGITP